MSLNRDLFCRRSLAGSRRISRPAALSTNVPGERSLFHPAMNPGLLESFESSRLSVRQSWFGAAFWESPMATAGSD
jgi:hypothetical protein